MPRQSSASRHFKVHSSMERLKPPAELTAAEKKIFIELVANNKAEHFRVSDLPLLIAYVHACATEPALARKLADDDKALLKWERVCKTMIAISMRLRLSPQSRTPTHPSRPNPDGVRLSPTPMNYFERMALQNGGDDA